MTGGQIYPEKLGKARKIPGTMQPIYPMFSRGQQGGHGFARRAAAGLDEQPGQSFSLTEKPE